MRDNTAAEDLEAKDDSERKRLFDEVFETHSRARIPLRHDRAELEKAFEIIFEFPNVEP